MKARVWFEGKSTILPGNIVELIWNDGRSVQLSMSPDEKGVCLLRAFPSDHKGLTELSMTFSLSPYGLEIRSLDTTLPNMLGRS